MGKLNKVAIYGMARSGKAALELAKSLGHTVVAVNKGIPAEWHAREGLAGLIELKDCYPEEDFVDGFAAVDEIVLSPGIPTTHPCLAKALKAGVPIISEIEFAYRQCSSVPLIAITGTNGKTTTTTMIAEALRKAGKRVFCGGNIGTPYARLPLSGEAFDYAVIEVSSFQLETIDRFHPDIGLILNISPNHGERYSSVVDYARAKFRLVKNMTAGDHLILGLENPHLEEIRRALPHQHFFQKGALPPTFAFDFSRSRLRGAHNQANFYACYKTLEILGIPQLDGLFQNFINEFRGVPHRLEFVLACDGLAIYNDAKSTNALATTTAIAAFKDDPAPFYLILGGKLRNEADRLLPELLPYKDKIRKIFTIGEVAERLRAELEGEFAVTVASDLKKLFQIAREERLQGNLVFSPGFPSFDQFKNFEDRGDCFRSWAREAFPGVNN